MNIRFYNGRVLPMCDDLSVIEEGEVWVVNDKIAYAGPASDTKKFVSTTNFVFDDDWDREIDLKGNLVMPGFKDAHTHSGMTFLRSSADDMKLSEWLTEKVFPREAKLHARDLYYTTKLAIMEYLTSGITTVCEMYLKPDVIANAMESSGMRCVQCGGLNNFSQSIESLRKWYKDINNGNPLSSFRLGIHAEYTCSKELLEEVAALSEELQAPVYLHNSETKQEVQACKERYGKTPTEFLNDLGLFEYGATFFHGVHMTDRDMEIMQEKNISVVTNPASNIKLASGIAPIAKYMEKGIQIGIGTDGPTSNNCLDMFREMFLTTGLAKVREDDASVVDAGEVLKMAVSGSAHAMGLYDCDCLAPGKKADLIVIDMSQPNMRPITNIPKNLVYSGSKSNVRLTMVDGKILYEDGKYDIGTKPEDIYDYVQNLIYRV